MIDIVFGTVVVFAVAKPSDMKRIIFVLPLCIFLANCSSTKNAAPPAGPGISNVNVSANGAAPTAVNTSATTSQAGRDWAYRAKHDSTLNGNWALQGMLASNGTWTSTVQDTAGTVAATAADAQAATTADATGMGATGSMGAAGSAGTDMAADNSTATGAKAKAKAKTNKRAVYDSAKVRLGYEVQSPAAVVDSSLLQPYKYWGRTPSLVINTTSRVFSGTTGCNSMSGSFNFSGNDLQFKAINTSKMNCNEYDEAGFLAALKKVDSYNVNGNLLELKQGGTVLLTFAKK